MVVMLLQKVPQSLRGELTRWLIEIKAGVYIGHVSAMVRDRLWDKCSNNCGAGTVLQAWSTNSEQHFKMRMVGESGRCITDWEGVELIQELKEELTQPQKRRTRRMV